LTQVFPLAEGEQFSFCDTCWWGQWGTNRVPPDTGLMRNGSPDTSIVDERNAFLLNRDCPWARSLVIGVRGYRPGHVLRVASVVIDWDSTVPDAADPRASLPAAWSLGAAYPNPFNGAVTVPLQVGSPGNATVEIYNLLGQRVATLFNGQASPGLNQLRWQPENLGSGVYLVRVNAPSFTSTQRITYVR
jgi:hypothetical protein